MGIRYIQNRGRIFVSLQSICIAYKIPLSNIADIISHRIPQYESTHKCRLTGNTSYSNFDGNFFCDNPTKLKLKIIEANHDLRDIWVPSVWEDLFQ